MTRNKKAFTLIELMVVLLVIAIISTLAITSYSSVDRRGRDTKRISDIAKIQLALEKYHQNKGFYPSSLSFGSALTDTSSPAITYLDPVPQNPLPYNDGNCTSTEYTYTPMSNDNYYLKFCISTKNNDLSAGNQCFGPRGSSCYFSPQEIAGLQLWLKGSGQMSTSSSGGNILISSWIDESGHNNNLTQGTEADKPKLVTGFNGQKMAQFDTTDSLSNSSFLNINNFPNNQATVIVVYGLNSTVNEYVVASDFASTVKWRKSSNGNGAWLMFSAAVPTEFPATMPNSGNHVTIMTTINDSYDFYLDNSAVQNSAGSFARNSALYLGNNTAVSFDGYIAEVIIYNHVLSSLEITAIKTYLGEKYNITTL